MKIAQVHEYESIPKNEDDVAVIVLDIEDVQDLLDSARVANAAKIYCCLLAKDICEVIGE